MQPKVKAWIVFPGGTKFGSGRAELLRRIDTEGSLNRAVQSMGMSYRAAWGYVRELESAAGFAFVEPVGPGPSAGMRLTDEGRAFLESFEVYRERVQNSAGSAYGATFGATADDRD